MTPLSRRGQPQRRFIAKAGFCYAFATISCWAIVGMARGAAQKDAIPLSKSQEARFWRQTAARPDFWQGSWQSISPIADVPELPPQYTPYARKYIRNYRPSDVSPFASCKPAGMPLIMDIGGMPIKFFDSPGMIALYVESAGATRFIHTDGRLPSKHPNPTYLGDSIARWEGNTLVVETNGFQPGTLIQIGQKKPTGSMAGNPLAGTVFAPHGPDMRLVEHIKLVKFNTLSIQTTIYDSKYFEKPYVLKPRLFIRGIQPRNDPQEWFCTDNSDYLNMTNPDDVPK
jgi:hypothetical protein